MLDQRLSESETHDSSECTMELHRRQSQNLAVKQSFHFCPWPISQPLNSAEHWVSATEPSRKSTEIVFWTHYAFLLIPSNFLTRFLNVGFDVFRIGTGDLRGTILTRGCTGWGVFFRSSLGKSEVCRRSLNLSWLGTMTSSSASSNWRPGLQEQSYIGHQKTELTLQYLPRNGR